MNYLAVALGSACGGVLRFALAGWLTRTMTSSFPWGTLGVNIAGCALIGLLAAVIPPEIRGIPWRLFLLPGLCGGFTTFSAFSLEAYSLWRAGSADKALIYVAASVLLCMVAVAIGVYVGERYLANSSN